MHVRTTPFLTSGRATQGGRRSFIHLEKLTSPESFAERQGIRGRRVDSVVRLPRSAMRDQNQVLVVDQDNRLHFRQVTVLRLEHDDMLVSEGLNDGELVCISPMQTVVEGMLVQPVTE